MPTKAELEAENARLTAQVARYASRRDAARAKVNEAREHMSKAKVALTEAVQLLEKD
jgi:hypothetical protein